MLAWRLTRRTHIHEPLSGIGAARFGNRWNSPGVRMGYTSSSRPLAVLEMLVHVSRNTVPRDPMFIPIDVPDELIHEVAIPSGWNALPESAAARHLGDRWIERGASVAMLVPSVILPAEKNVLINPVHADFGRIRILPVEPFTFDRRLLR